jgi:hypothetical protein
VVCACPLTGAVGFSSQKDYYVFLVHLPQKVKKWFSKETTIAKKKTQ